MKAVTRKNQSWLFCSGGLASTKIMIHIFSFKRHLLIFLHECVRRRLSPMKGPENAQSVRKEKKSLVLVRSFCISGVQPENSFFDFFTLQPHCVSQVKCVWFSSFLRAFWCVSNRSGSGRSEDAFCSAAGWLVLFRIVFRGPSRS